MDNEKKLPSTELLKILTRKKDITEVPTEQSGNKLARVLGFLDLMALGVGSTLGLGVYVLAGSVAKTDAGPAVILSFLVGALTSAFAALCYAEFASRVPKAGSAYIYSYVTVGEFAAFVIGWNLILEYAIGTASVAKGLSNYVDSLLGHAMKNTMTEMMPIGISFLSSYPDFFSASLVFLLTGLLCWGVKESTMVNNVFTILNLTTVIMVVITGLFKVNPHYWTIPKKEIPKNVNGGEGGFLPFGWSGVMSGAAKCFYGYIGFDVIASTGEEARNPSRNIPLTLLLSLLIIFLSYFGVASVLTMLVPYYSQDSDAPLPYAFASVELYFLKWIITSGAVCALFASMFGAAFPLPRVLYSMSIDGLISPIFSKIHPVTKTPIIGTSICGTLAAILAGTFNLEQLINMMSIGTLLAYSVVAICVLVLRYQRGTTETKHLAAFESRIGNDSSTWRSFVVFKQCINLYGLKYSTAETEKLSQIGIFSFCISSLLLCFTFIYGNRIIGVVDICNAVCILLLIWLICSFVIICRQPQSNPAISFKVPVVPLTPCCSILSNIFLMMKLDLDTWVRFVLWFIFGLLTYTFYSINHSTQGIKNKTKSSALPLGTKPT